MQYITIYYSIYSLYYSIYPSEFRSVFRRNMGKPRKENLLINAERIHKWRQKNQDKNLKQKREAYAQKTTDNFYRRIENTLRISSCKKSHVQAKVES